MTLPPVPTRYPTRRPARLLAATLIALVMAGAVYAIYRVTYKDVTLEIGGQVERVASRAETVGGLLAERRVMLVPGDHVSPAPDTPLEAGMTIAIDRAHRVVIEADGEVRRVTTVAIHPLDILREQGIDVSARDIVRVDGHDYWLDTLERTHWDLPPASILVLRSATLRVFENGTVRVIHTTEREVGRALDDAGIDLYLADTVEPGLSATVEDGMAVTLRRSLPVTIVVDGRALRTRAAGLTVGDVEHWLVHPGGRGIVDGVQAGLDLADEVVAPSRAVLAEYGNVGTPSAFFVFEEVVRQRSPRAGDHGLVVTIGPGVTVGLLLLRW
mgnify:CR=1 FL=1